MSADHCAVSPQRGSRAYKRLIIDTMYREMSSWSTDIGKYARGTTKDIVFYLNTLIDRYVVLNTNAVANLDIIANIDILPKRAVSTNKGTFLNVAEMPYLGIVAYNYIVIDIAALMNEIRHC